MSPTAYLLPGHSGSTAAAGSGRPREGSFIGCACSTVAGWAVTAVAASGATSPCCPPPCRGRRGGGGASIAMRRPANSPPCPLRPRGGAAGPEKNVLGAGGEGLYHFRAQHGAGFSADPIQPCRILLVHHSRDHMMLQLRLAVCFNESQSTQQQAVSPPCLQGGIPSRTLRCIIRLYMLRSAVLL
eukprot:COSAG01_NODE_5093_length_4492_cov_15.651719_3_plen_185_part_00